MIKNSDFKQWLRELKTRIRQSQIKAAIKVNTELLHLYWDLGRDIAERRLDATFGSGFYKNLSKELMAEFPDMKGFSITNLNYCKQFYQFYSRDKKDHQQTTNANLPQLGEDLQAPSIFQIPWGHQKHIIYKCQSVQEALFYVNKTIVNGWSRASLMNFIELDLYTSQGRAISNFDRLLPAAQSDLAKETIKDPYVFDFFTLTEDYKEKELEDALVTNITKFLLELGQGFAYLGRQVPIQIGSRERFLDLLFYHLDLRCYVVVELKTKEFEAEHTGKLGLYISAINHQKKKEIDNPTIGLLICKTKDNIEVQYSLESSSLPISISEYKLMRDLPKDFKSSLPSIEDIEEELNKKES